MTPDKVEEKFLKELCWQDTDGKWFLNGTPDTVPKILKFITQYHQDLMNEVVGKESEKIKRIKNEVGGFIAGSYAMKFEDNSREAKFWDVWKDGYEQCRKDALSAIDYENRGQD